MKRNLDYNILETILIENYDLITTTNNHIYQICRKNNIQTLGELIRRIDKDEIELKHNKHQDEIRGFIDLVKLRHFGIDLPNRQIFSGIMKFVPNSYKGKYHNILSEIEYNRTEYNRPLRSLGLTPKESEIIEHFVKDLRESKIIIDALFNYRVYCENEYIRKNIKEILIKKLDILLNYYKTKCMEYDAHDINRAIELEKLLDRFYELKKTKESSNIISILEEEIKRKKELVNKEYVKKLMIKYEDK